MGYMMFSMLSGLMIYKIISFGNFIAPASIGVTPFIYCLSNITTEVYGYQVSRNMMWWFILLSAIFSVLSFILVQLPSPSDFKDQHSYTLILGTMPIIFIAGVTGILIGMSSNNYIVSKLKVIMAGKAYIIRSLISTCSGEVIYNFIAYPIMYFSKFPLLKIIHMIIYVSCYKVITTAVFVIPESFIANYLKRKEKIDIFDENINYNIFKIKLFVEKQNKPSLKIVKNNST